MNLDQQWRRIDQSKMISSPKKGNFQSKQEGEINHGKNSKASTSERQWFGLRNPRIVRVSRSFGGKDRHSKVCTIKGLRDRRIRLSVPTAIQLYDLQERLGVGQPSKVIDWLLDVTKLDIDKLPPLQFPGFGQFPQHMLLSHDLISNQANQSSSFWPFFNANSASTFIKDVEDGDSRAKGKGKSVENDCPTHIEAHNFLLNNSRSENTSSLSIQGPGLYPSQIEDHQPNSATFFTPFSTPQFNHFQFLGSSLSIEPTLRSFPKLLLPQQNGCQEKNNGATGSRSLASLKDFHQLM